MPSLAVVVLAITTSSKIDITNTRASAAGFPSMPITVPRTCALPSATAEESRVSTSKARRKGIVLIISSTTLADEMVDDEDLAVPNLSPPVSDGVHPETSARPSLR